MPFLTLMEIFDIAIMTLAMGYIFTSFIRREPLEGYDPLEYYNRPQIWERVKFGALLAFPSVVMHEFAHKIVAMSYGAVAVIKAPYIWYAIAIGLKIIGFPIILLVGGYVAHTPLQPFPSAMVSIAGPLTNFIIFLVLWLAIKYNILKKYHKIMGPLSKLNLYLAGINMLPFFGFDGYNFFKNIFLTFT